jgi:hypothetical protein
MATIKTTEAAVVKPAGTISEGTRRDLELRGYAISPFTGALLVGSGSDDVRVVELEEYQAAVKANAAKHAKTKAPTHL